MVMPAAASWGLILAVTSGHSCWISGVLVEHVRRLTRGAMLTSFLSTRLSIRGKKGKKGKKVSDQKGK